MSGEWGEEQRTIRGKVADRVMPGQILQQVAKDIGVHYIIDSPWYSHDKAGKFPSNWKRSGRPSELNKILKIALNKDLTKKRQLTRKMAEKLKANVHPLCHMTVPDYVGVVFLD